MIEGDSAPDPEELTGAVMDVLRSIPDPEMPISIVDLGLIERLDVEAVPGGAAVAIDVLPTFVGCPALPVIDRDITERVGALPAVREVRVRFVNDPPWTVDRISPEGRRSLREHGVTVPPHSGDGGAVTLRTSAVPCPFCDSRSTRLDSPFGPTRCRMIYYCEACRNTFEHMKRV